MGIVEAKEGSGRGVIPKLPFEAVVGQRSQVPQRAEGRMLLSRRMQPRKWSPSLYTCQMCPIVMRHLTHICLGISGRHSVGHLYVEHS